MTSEYRDYGYTEPGHASGAAGRALASKYVELVALLPEISRVCDLGCGNGYLAAELGKAGYRVTGVDASASGIEVAQRHYRSDQVDFIRADFTAAEPATSLVPASYDAVVSSDVIEHLYRPGALIEVAARILKPEGFIVVGTPYHGYLKDLAIAIAGKWDSHHNPNWDGGHIKFFAVASLKALLLKHGFKDPQLHFHGRGPLLWKNMICVARKGTKG
jgi:SAM-dependent methyltransferase